MSVRIITDSASDLSPAEHPALAVLPLSVTFGTDVYMDGVDIDHQRFYEMLVERDELPKTGQVNPYAFSQAIAEAREAGDEAVIITVGAKLSGTNQSARTALAEAPGGDVFVVDSNNVTLGERVMFVFGNTAEMLQFCQGYKLDAINLGATANHDGADQVGGKDSSVFFDATQKADVNQLLDMGIKLYVQQTPTYQSVDIDAKL